MKIKCKHNEVLKWPLVEPPLTWCAECGAIKFSSWKDFIHPVGSRDKALLLFEKVRP